MCHRGGLSANLEQARRIGYPLMLEAAAGGGGRGIRSVSSDDELRVAYQRTSEEAERAFGNGDIRAVMRAVADQDHAALERWADMAEAESAVIVDARIGGWPVCLIGIESRPRAVEVGSVDAIIPQAGCGPPSPRT